jgi:hypothetical protein
VEKEQKTSCHHGEEERAFISVYTCDEVAYAVQLGYRVMSKYEAYIYTENKSIFKDFLGFLAKYKVPFQIP